MSEPRTVFVDGVDVLPPTCIDCEGNTHTRWEHLPPLDEIKKGSWGSASCHSCHSHQFSVEPVACFRAREPERLAARLAELKAEGWR